MIGSTVPGWHGGDSIGQRLVVLVTLALALAGCAGTPPGGDNQTPGDVDTTPPASEDEDDGSDGGSSSVTDPLHLNTTVERSTHQGGPVANVTLQVTVNWPELGTLELGVRAPEGFEPLERPQTTIDSPEEGSEHTWTVQLSLPKEDAEGLLRTWATANQTLASRVSATQTLKLIWEDDRLSSASAAWPHDSQGGFLLDVTPHDNRTARVTATLYTNQTTPESRFVVETIDGSTAVSLEHPSAQANGSELVWRGETTPQGVELSFNLTLAGDGQAQASIGFLPPVNLDAAQYSGSIVLSSDGGNLTVDRVQDDPPPGGGDGVSPAEGGG